MTNHRRNLRPDYKTTDMMDNMKKHRITMLAMWLWPVVLLPFFGGNNIDGTYWSWFLSKSPWLLFAGVMQSWVYLVTKKVPQEKKELFMIVMVFLTTASVFLLPFGLAKWDNYLELIGYETHYVYEMNPYWDYEENLLPSFLLHFLVPLLPIVVIVGLSTDTGVYTASSSSYSNYSYSDSGYDDSEEDELLGAAAATGLYYAARHHHRQSDSWLDNVMRGGDISDSFIGHRGEFDRNDEARRISEDIQQFHYAHPDADLSDHYHWEDILDADTDGYLDD